MPTRRQFLTGVGSAAVAVATSSTATAQTDESFSEQPDHVTINGLDEERTAIERYRPLLDLSNVEVRPTDLHAWEVVSEEFDYDWYCYWAFYTAQQGVRSEDSHLPDREPVYVAVEDGSVDHIIVSDWHYAAEVIEDPELYETTHPRLRVIEPWHGTTPTDSGGEFVSLANMKSTYPDWLANGWNVDRRSVVDPPTAEERGNWWREDDQFNHSLAVWWHDLSVPFDWNPFTIEGW
ncbi:twin-arginine translocation signal domain-containing protein [Haloarcula amylovorans]|uniref:twin-arginine translocation signal domain-containing protein n=1 Tax=Haloarcula amylovorans TaxID=2562280 RepID=UPI0010765621|nr:twin-arginine translocation signal domain-containing protein [Halomicroarcula amylolytica]